MIVYAGIRLPSVIRRLSTFSKTTSPLKPRNRFFSYFTYIIYRSEEQIIVFFFCSGRIRTLVALGKEEIDILFCLNGNVWCFFYRNVY